MFAGTLRNRFCATWRFPYVVHFCRRQPTSSFSHQQLMEMIVGVPIQAVPKDIQQVCTQQQLVERIVVVPIQMMHVPKATQQQGTQQQMGR